ncbi:MAG: DNA replication/repair protein RecF [Clostridia bacterium]|nr:DNA replication/repair protein RecF [Clostridia bacterium]
MKIQAFQAQGLRNLNDTTLVPHGNVNIIYGDNAQGKTNLLEGMWLFTGLRSFRGAKDNEIISKDGRFCKLELDFFASGREQKAKMVISDTKKAQLNGVDLKSASALAGSFCAVVFSPVHLALIKDGPAVRRKFIDSALCQAKPSYAALLTKYSRALSQRNALLHDARFHSQLFDMIDMWNAELCSAGAQIMALRSKYLIRLGEQAREIYSGISGGKETLDISYLPSFEYDEASVISCFEQALKNSLSEDMRCGSTTVGPHRDNFEILVDGLSARKFGSQGQQRSCVLALKLAEASLLSKITGEQPVALLDDVMSELDAGRQDYLLNRMTDWQVFITCCDPHPILRLAGGSCFEMTGGVLQQSTLL